MTTRSSNPALRRTLCTTGLALAALSLSVLLSACGGEIAAERDGANEVARAAGADIGNAPLLSDDGSVMPSDPATVPADRAARTRAGHYASPLQAQTLEAAFGEDVLRVNVECCGAGGIDQAIAIAHGLQAARDLPNSAPVLVRAADLRLGAIAADRLATLGHSRVWLVTR